MRVNVESDLWASGRLGAFARALGVGEREALGVLVYVWHETQHRELMMVTVESFEAAISIRLGDLDASKVLAAMARAQLVSQVDSETWLIRGNDEHVARLRHLRASASTGGQASAQARGHRKLNQKAKQTVNHMVNHKVNHMVEQTVEHKATITEPPPNAPYSLLLTPKDHDPDLTSPVQDPISDRRSLVSSESQSELALTAPPSAAAVALHVLDIKPPKRKERSPEQKKRSVNNAHLYRDLYEQAEGHQPAGLDQAFYGAMAKFSDKYGDDACHIIAWAFQCPDKSFRAKGWPLPLIIEQAPRLWRELNDPNKAIANIAAPRQQQQLALAAANEMAFTEFLARHGEVPNATR